MTNIYKTLFSTILFLFLNQLLFSQDIHDKLSIQLCECIEKQQLKNAEEMESCYEDLIMKNFEEIKKYYKASTISEIDMEALGGKIGARIIKDCDYVLNNFPDGVVGNEKKVEKQIDLNCENLKQGNYYYLTQRPNSNIRDTTFVTISNKMYLERMRNGRTYSLLEIKWKNECKFELEFQESNDPLKKEISQPGDIYKYEILVNDENSIFLKTFWQKREYQFELVKIK